MDWLEQYKSYQNIKEVREYIENVQKLRFLYQTMNYKEMQQHIGDLMRKYPMESVIWNTTNNIMPQTYEQMYRNAEAFLQTVGVQLLIEKLNFNH